MSLTKDYQRVLEAVPDGMFDLDDPNYQPQLFLEFNEMSDYSNQVVRCLHCKTVINYHPTESRGEECPFCHRDFDSKSVEILASAEIKALKEDV